MLGQTHYMLDPSLPSTITPFQLRFGRSARTTFGMLFPQMNDTEATGGLGYLIESLRCRDITAVFRSKHGRERPRPWHGRVITRSSGNGWDQCWCTRNETARGLCDYKVVFEGSEHGHRDWRGKTIARTVCVGSIITHTLPHFGAHETRSTRWGAISRQYHGARM